MTLPHPTDPAQLDQPILVTFTDENYSDLLVTFPLVSNAMLSSLLGEAYIEFTHMQAFVTDSDCNPDPITAPIDILLWLEPCKFEMPSEEELALKTHQLDLAEIDSWSSGEIKFTSPAFRVVDLSGVASSVTCSSSDIS